MRAGRLITLVLLLQRHGRLTAAALAAELEVSERTVLRDIESLSGAGVPVYAVRGPGGGFQLLGDTAAELVGADSWLRAPARREDRGRRAVVQVSPEGRRLAAVLGRLQPLRLRATSPPTPDGWRVATFRMDSLEGAVVDVLSLGPHIRVLEPAALRARVADDLERAALLYRDPSD